MLQNLIFTSNGENLLWSNLALIHFLKQSKFIFEKELKICNPWVPFKAL